MSEDCGVFRLVIDSPEPLSMARIAEYMRLFAELLGNEEHVRLAGVEQD